MQDAKQFLCDALEDVDQSIFFLLLVITATLLSFWAIIIQRKGLCLTIQDQTQAAARLPPVFPIRCRSSALLVGSLGFFLCLALKSCAQAGDDPVKQRSAHANLLASVLVLSAALIRWQDIHFVEACQPAELAEDTLPD